MCTVRKFTWIALIGMIIFLPINIKADQTSALFNTPTNDDSLRWGIIIDNGLEFQVKAQGQTVKEFLNNAGIQLQENDIVFPALDKDFQSGTKIIIERATPVVLNLYGAGQKIFTQRELVKEVLEDQGIKLKVDDLINFQGNDKIFPGMEIKIWEKPKPQIKITPTGEEQIGLASWYSFIPGNFCASTTFKKGTKLRVTNLANGREVIVTVNDSGPFTNKIIDLEKTAFAKLAPLSKGVIKVRVEKVLINYQ